MPVDREHLRDKRLGEYLPAEREKELSQVWNAATYAYHRLVADAIDDPRLTTSDRRMMNDFGFRLNQGVRGSLESGTYPYFYMIILGDQKKQYDLSGIIARSLADPNAPQIWDAHETIPPSAQDCVWQASTIPGLYICTLTYKIPQSFPSRSIGGINTIPSLVRPRPTR